MQNKKKAKPSHVAKQNEETLRAAVYAVCLRQQFTKEQPVIVSIYTTELSQHCCQQVQKHLTTEMQHFAFI